MTRANVRTVSTRFSHVTTAALIETGGHHSGCLERELAKRLAYSTDALHRAETLFKEALPKFNWGASALDANAIKLLNDVPLEIRALLKAGES